MQVPELDVIPMTDDTAAIEAARKEAEAVEQQTKLFNGLKFFLGREVSQPEWFQYESLFYGSIYYKKIKNTYFYSILVDINW